MLELALTLLLGVAGQEPPAGDGKTWPDQWESSGEEGEMPAAEAPATTPVKAARPATGKAQQRSKIQRRRTRGKAGASLVGWVIPEDHLRVAPPQKPSGNVHVHVLATKEQTKVNIYNPDGSYNVEAVDAISHLLRCKRTDAERQIEPRLLTILSHVYDRFGGKRIDVVSGYRNQRKTTSHHFRGSAMDIVIDGVPARKLRDFVDSLDAGGMGVGLYPRAGFVHVDVRPPPSYRWIDNSRSDPDNPDKRPPRGWKRKRPVS